MSAPGIIITSNPDGDSWIRQYFDAIVKIKDEIVFLEYKTANGDTCSLSTTSIWPNKIVERKLSKEKPYFRQFEKRNKW